MMNKLEETINSLSPRIKSITVDGIRAGVPFQYMMNLSRVGERDYGVPFEDSFWFGVDKSLDWYNNHKRYGGDNLQTEFYALKQGAEWILRYCYYNQVVEQDDDEYYEDE